MEPSGPVERGSRAGRPSEMPSHSHTLSASRGPSHPRAGRSAGLEKAPCTARPLSRSRKLFPGTLRCSGWARRGLCMQTDLGWTLSSTPTDRAQAHPTTSRSLGFDLNTMRAEWPPQPSLGRQLEGTCLRCPHSLWHTEAFKGRLVVSAGCPQSQALKQEVIYLGGDSGITSSPERVG